MTLGTGFEEYGLHEVRSFSTASTYVLSEILNIWLFHWKTPRENTIPITIPIHEHDFNTLLERFYSPLDFYYIKHVY